MLGCMSATFIGRERELGVLASAHASKGSVFVPVYGRRRVGKSELLLHFLASRPGVYLLGKQAPAALQRREFLEQAAKTLGEPLLASYEAESWASALAAVTRHWRGQQKLVLAFDEFQWTAAASPELPSVLQGMLDGEWRREGKVMLVLCGSYVGFMEKELLGRKSPLFGRRTAQILLRPFDYRESALFHPRWSLLDRARAYFVCGGVPLYLRFFDPGLSLEANIASRLLDEYAPLYREPDFLLREELREVESYHAVLFALARGSLPNRDISRLAGIGDRKLHYYLQTLVELGYVKRRYPLTERGPLSRQVRLELDDPLLRFWFRFVFPRTSQILQLGPQRALRELVRPELDAYFGSCFERLCREALPALYAHTGVTASFEVGEYWDAETQIDVVGLRDDGWTDLGECKWGPGGSAAALERELEEKVRRYPNRRNATIGRLLFTRQPLRVDRAGTDQVVRYCLEDLYAL